ncbi:MAG: PqqD family protein [Treponema sp.]|nr:PqqD family protein [Treponema sp.]
MTKHKKSENYLDLVFEHNPAFRYEESESGEITIFVENKGVFNRLMQRFFGKPKVSKIHLEEFGNFIWKQIDGTQNVNLISEKVHEKFAEKAEPLIPRLVQYFKILESNSFITRKSI